MPAKRLIGVVVLGLGLTLALLAFLQTTLAAPASPGTGERRGFDLHELQVPGNPNSLSQRSGSFT